jgi:hypothetical protein
MDLIDGNLALVRDRLAEYQVSMLKRDLVCVKRDPACAKIDLRIGR